MECDFLNIWQELFGFQKQFEFVFALFSINIGSDGRRINVFGFISGHCSVSRAGCAASTTYGIATVSIGRGLECRKVELKGKGRKARGADPDYVR